MSSVGLDLNPSLGALEIGVISSTLLFGVLTLQVYMYFSNFPKDAISVKGQVALVWLCELGDLICMTHSVYIFSVTKYGQPESLMKPPVTVPAGVLFSILIVPISQSYFALRVYKLSKKPLIPVLSSILSFITCVTSLAAGVTGFEMTNLEVYVAKWAWLLAINALVRPVNDILITATLVMQFYWRRDSIYAKSTARIVDKLIEWTIATGLITAVTSASMGICFLTMRNNYIWIAIWTLMSQLYANSYLAALNSRLTLRAMKEDIVLIDTEAGHMSNSQPNHQATGVQIEFTRTVVTDAESTKAVQKGGLEENQVVK